MQQITVDELKEKLSHNDHLLLLDVREDAEHEKFSIGGVHIPLGDVMRKANQIPTEVPVIVCCRKGVRSQIAIQRLEDKFGFTNLFNLEGGLENW